MMQRRIDVVNEIKDMLIKECYVKEEPRVVIEGAGGQPPKVEQ